MSFVVTPHQLEQRAELYHQLGSLLSAGIPLPAAIEHLHKSPPSRDMRKPLACLSQELALGQTFAEALTTAGKWTPSFDIAMLQAGEKSGRLDACFKLLAEYYRERAKLARELISSLMYPVLLLHVAILIFPVRLLPKLVWDGDVMPFILQKLMMFIPLYGIVLFLIVACQGRRGEKWRTGIEKISNLIPLIGSARKNLALARLAAALEALINAGVSIFEAWEMAATASGSPGLRTAVFSWRPQLESGQTPAEALAASPRFPELFSNLYYSGEVSGQQDETLRRLHNYYQEEGSRKMRQIAQWIPRLIYFAIVGAIAYQIFGFWLGYFSQLNDAMK